MTTETSKAALKQMEKSAYLVTSIRTQKPIVNQRLTGLNAEIFRGDSATDAPVAPDWDHQQNWAISALEAAVEEIRQTDRAHRHRLVLLGQRRLERTAFVAETSKAYRRLRQVFTGNFGKEALTLVGLEAVLERSYLAIGNQMRELVTRMRDPNLAGILPEPAAGQPTVDLEAVATAWEERGTRLDQLNAEVEADVNRAQESRVLLREALRRSRRLYANVGRLQEGIYRLAGLDDLADRMRATQRAPRKKDDGEESSGEESSGEATESQPAEGAEAISSLALDGPSGTVAGSSRASLSGLEHSPTRSVGTSRYPAG